MARRVREIGLFLPPTVGYFADIVMGVQEFARGAGGWVVESCQSLDIATAATRGWRPDGVLVNNTDGEWHRLLRELGVPVVQVGGPAIPGTARVTTDNDAIGRMAAAHFLERGFRRFAFCGYAHLDWSCQREQGFRDGLGDAGGAAARDCPGLRARDGEICAAAVTGLLADWVRGLPKPVAIFACHDRAAMFVANAAAQVRTRVPEDVAVLGVDDSLLECGFASPPISSIMGSARRVGYEAAALLDRLMGGAEIPRESVAVPPAGVVVRQSTDVLAIDDADVIAAVKFIGQHASEPIEVGDVAEATLVSRRLLERKFRALLSRTPREEILRAHLACAKMLLVNSDAQTLDVALRSGFPSASKFSAVFKRETGLSPTAFRRLYSTRVTTAPTHPRA